jgi:6-phosphogluconate dehydrogenase
VFSRIKEAFDRNPTFHLLLDPFFAEDHLSSPPGEMWLPRPPQRIWTPALSTALQYFDGLRPPVFRPIFWASDYFGHTGTSGLTPRG